MTACGSLPSRERGLKSPFVAGVLATLGVAPFAGAWIEMGYCISRTKEALQVAPFAGAWIEITGGRYHVADVANRRSLRGSVD